MFFTVANKSNKCNKLKIFRKKSWESKTIFSAIKKQKTYNDSCILLNFQMIFGGPSPFLREMFPKEEPCECNNLTIHLPDFDANTIKNLLSILYTGKHVIFDLQ